MRKRVASVGRGVAHDRNGLPGVRKVFAGVGIRVAGVGKLKFCGRRVDERGVVEREVGEGGVVGACEGLISSGVT